MDKGAAPYQPPQRPEAAVYNSYKQSTEGTITNGTPDGRPSSLASSAMHFAAAVKAISNRPTTLAEARHILVVRARVLERKLSYLILIHDQNAITVHYCLETMDYGQDDAVLELAAYHRLHNLACLGIDVCYGFI
ncbi:hypothetical protein BX070DRAFT_253352 [Coemansia spiralis]|uniref:Uncharacterized protein n=1 Tax=Coemansia umbellata TaxID=1424467 RepID=A0ABQ8PEY2_9FUNG|nr:hypothetical protein BX070DRAFT_253352 [Coemansia spiralis]KAJ1987771.1 hypothetical protein EDC05_005657 [Coemansia umbellata]